jgi:sugar lactone lactonase YvrE
MGPDVTNPGVRCARVPTSEGQDVSQSHHTSAVLLLALSCTVAACGGNQDQASRPSEAATAPASPQPSGRALALGQMATVAGGGEEVGNGGPATAAGLCGPTDVALDRAGTMYIADAGLYCPGPGGNSVRKIDGNGIITTVAGGTGVVGFGGDGGPAAEALLNAPLAVAVDADGNLYISDADNFRVRKVDTTGTITTVAGTGEQGFSGDGGPATSARLMNPSGMAFDGRGNLYLADYAAVRKIDGSGRITTVAGTGKWFRKPDREHISVGPRKRFAGDGGRAADAMLVADDVALDRRGNLYIADGSGDRVYRVDSQGIIRTVAGSVSGKGTRLGDGGPATSAFLDLPAAVAVDRPGNVLIADHHGERIRRVDRRGTITTIAGTGEKGASAERGPATKLNLNDPSGLALGEPGILYIADLFNARIMAVHYAEREP